ncbi:MAG: phosphoglycolate phosphatase [Clostridiales bacterium]|nr:MAG: phosphoglycolate phosphatase [Clostridiales bacterium]
MALIIFDLDGTLIRSYHGLAKATNMVLEEYGFPTHDYESYIGFIGGGVANLVYRALPEGEKHLRDEVYDKMYENYKTCYDFMLEPYDDIKNMLEKLQESGHKLCVSSNKNDDMTKKIVAEYFSETKFELVLGASEQNKKKPDPKMINICVESCGFDKEDVYVVGDSGFDIQSSRNVGVKNIFVTWGYRKYEAVVDLKPDYKVDNPLDIVKIVGEC